MTAKPVAPEVEFERYMWFLNGQMTGVFLGVGIGLGCAGYALGMLFVLAWAVIHLCARRLIRHA